MNVIHSSISTDPGTLQQILSMRIGFADGDVQAVTDKLAELILLQLTDTIMPDVEAKLLSQIPELIQKIGSEIAIEGLKNLLQKDT